MVTPLLLVATLLGAPDGGSADTHHAAVRGQYEVVRGGLMGEPHRLIPPVVHPGGVISADALDRADIATRDSIRSHFAHIAHAFSSGDFDLPMFIHDRMPPGAETMKRLRTKISYRAENAPLGARVVIRTGDPEALAAVHDFLRFQIADHRTGDSPQVQR